MSVVALTCPKCGGKLSPEEEVCPYCGTWYVVKEGRVISLLDMPATDKNMRKYIRLANLQWDHIIAATKGGMFEWRRTISKEECERISFTARNDLREELQREPSIKEVDARFTIYASPKTQEKVMTHTFLWSFIATIIVLLFVFLLMMLRPLRF